MTWCVGLCHLLATQSVAWGPAVYWHHVRVLKKRRITGSSQTFRARICILTGSPANFCTHQSLGNTILHCSQISCSFIIFHPTWGWATSTLSPWPATKCCLQGQEFGGFRNSTGHLVVFQWLYDVGKLFCSWEYRFTHLGKRKGIMIQHFCEAQITWWIWKCLVNCKILSKCKRLLLPHSVTWRPLTETTYLYNATSTN